MLQSGDVFRSNKATFTPKFFCGVATGRNWALCIHKTFPAFENTSVEEKNVAQNLFGIYFLRTVDITAGKTAGDLCPPREWGSFPIENFQVLCSVVPSAFYHFPGKILPATKAEKVTFPLPRKLEKLQDCKLMSGACKEAYCTCGMFMYKHLNSGLKNSTVLPYTCNLNLRGMSSTLRWCFSHLNVRLGWG